MHTLIIILNVLVSIFLVISVLLQFGKGASLGTSFGGGSSQAVLGGSGPTTFLGKLTIASAVIFMLTSLYLTYVSGTPKSSSLMNDVKGVSAPAETSAPAPAEQGAPAKQ